ncbi:DUF6941 family protein [Gordonia sp. SL306]|uniref:DUF6941 family protein n=1 Tax=Gordonia sp. SL306 TaxID=2995145 RepID=UPI00226F7D50|nr:hypothetical protein [Gordonia sp. SL306]WAC54258.1 hypothetical protein OVA31_16395 [Gordonia sp. SL306]
MKIRLLLADAAQADSSNGKVNALGLGWTTIPTPTPGFSLVMFLDIDWDETNQQHKLKCELLTDDGVAVHVPTPLGDQPVVFEAFAEAGRPPGTTHGTPLRMPLALTVGPGFPLPPGRYEWRVTVEGFDDATAVEGFTVVPQH